MKRPTFNQVTNFSEFVHFLLNVALPLTAVLLVFFDLTAVAILVVLLSKWRIFSVNPSFWFVNLRASAIDIIVGVGSVLMMAEAFAEIRGDSDLALFGSLWAAAWTVQYIAWLFYVKPKTSKPARTVQTLWSIIVGTWALTIYSQDLATMSMVLYYWLIGLSASRHFLSSREEKFVNGLSFVWGALFVQLGWLFSQWIHLYRVEGVFEIPQSTIILSATSYLAMKAYTEYRSEERSLKNIRWVGLSVALVVVVALATTDWSGING